MRKGVLKRPIHHEVGIPDKYCIGVYYSCIEEKEVQNMKGTEGQKYTPAQIKEAGSVLDVLDSVPKSKRYILRMVMEAFILGTELAEQCEAAQDSA